MHSADLPAYGGRTYQVALAARRVVDRWVLGRAAAVVVTAPGPPAPTPPETTLTSVPPTWLLSSSATVAYAASEAGSTYECRLDGGAVPCSGVVP